MDEMITTVVMKVKLAGTMLIKRIQRPVSLSAAETTVRELFKIPDGIQIELFAHDGQDFFSHASPVSSDVDQKLISCLGEHYVHIFHYSRITWS